MIVDFPSREVLMGEYNKYPKMVNNVREAREITADADRRLKAKIDEIIDKKVSEIMQGISLAAHNGDSYYRGKLSTSRDMVEPVQTVIECKLKRKGFVSISWERVASNRDGSSQTLAFTIAW